MRVSGFLLLFALGVALAAPAQPPPAVRARLRALAERQLDAGRDTPFALTEPAWANQYVSLRQQARWVASLPAILGPDPDIDRARAVLAGQTQDLLWRFQQQSGQPFLGEPAAFESPQLIIVLGANWPALAPRLTLALDLAQRFPQTPLLLSGGGRTRESEAERMAAFLRGHGLAEARLFKEELSLDTLGNAVFSKLLLKERGMRPTRVLLVTAAWHGARSLFLFQQVFGPGYALAVALAPSPDPNPEALKARLDAELTGIATVARNMFSPDDTVNLDPALVGDELSILSQMLLEHDLYKYRWDLARRFETAAPAGEVPERALRPGTPQVQP